MTMSAEAGGQSDLDSAGHLAGHQQTADSRPLTTPSRVTNNNYQSDDQSSSFSDVNKKAVSFNNDVKVQGNFCFNYYFYTEPNIFFYSDQLKQPINS